MSPWRALGAMAVAGLAAALLNAFGPPAQFTEDGYDYAIVMLMDRGMTYDAAQTSAERFYARHPVPLPQGGRVRLRGRPEYWNLFSVRRLYPWIASLLYPYRGIAALIDVSRASYVVTAMLTVLLAMRFAPVWCAVLLSVILSLFPPWRDLGRDALTDALAIALTTATLLVGATMFARVTWWRIAGFGALCAAAAFTRPIPYIELGAAIVAAIALRRSRNRAALAPAAWIVGISAMCVLAVEAALSAAHAPSFGWIVADAYRHFVAGGYAPAHESLARFYVREEQAIAIRALLKGAVTIVPALAIAGIVLRRRDRSTPFLGGACAATWIGALVDPNRFDMVRCVVMPVAPVMAAFAAASVHALSARIPATVGLQTLSLRHFLPRRVFVRNTTVKE